MEEESRFTLVWLVVGVGIVVLAIDLVEHLALDEPLILLIGHGRDALLDELLE